MPKLALIDFLPRTIGVFVALGYETNCIVLEVTAIYESFNVWLGVPSL